MHGEGIGIWNARVHFVHTRTIAHPASPRSHAPRKCEERGAGIHIFNSLDNAIDANRISFMRACMYLQNADTSEITYGFPNTALTWRT
jgi:nitrous oxidase accessory protein NosD